MMRSLMPYRFGVHNGKDFIPIEVQQSMIGHKLGEFSLTKKHPVHKKKETGIQKKINPKTGKSG